MSPDDDVDDVVNDVIDEEIVAKLKALPPEGNEPDWHKLEAAIRAEVGTRAPTMWWRNWKWIVPIWALATTAAVALIVMRDHHESAPQPPVSTHEHRDVAPPAAPRATTAPAMWLGGEVVDIDYLDDASLDSLDQAARDAFDSDDVSLEDLDDVSLEDLDDAGLDELESWLESTKS